LLAEAAATGADPGTSAALDVRVLRAAAPDSPQAAAQEPDHSAVAAEPAAELAVADPGTAPGSRFAVVPRVAGRPAQRRQPATVEDQRTAVASGHVLAVVRTVAGACTAAADSGAPAATTGVVDVVV